MSLIIPTLMTDKLTSPNEQIQAVESALIPYHNKDPPYLYQLQGRMRRTAIFIVRVLVERAAG